MSLRQLQTVAWLEVRQMAGARLIAIGALLAGVSLSFSPFHYEISAKVKTLRDFFLILFFVFLGSQMTFQDPAAYVLPEIGRAHV